MEEKGMHFRPCIDIHNGAIKQIVGGTLKDGQDKADTNFVSGYGAAYYAALYRADGLKGGHVILLNAKDSPYYNASRMQALQALSIYPGGLQIGGGITDENAANYILLGASHVIVTSFVFRNGQIMWENLEKLKKAVGKEHIVLDLSCRKKEGKYYIVTDRWQTFTDVVLTHKVLDELSGYCDEFLVHGVDVEGKGAGMEEGLVRMLASWRGIPITYAGGLHSLEEIERFQEFSEGRLDFTVGSGLDLFGGSVPYETVKEM